MDVVTIHDLATKTTISLRPSGQSTLLATIGRFNTLWFELKSSSMDEPDCYPHPDKRGWIIRRGGGFFREGRNEPETEVFVPDEAIEPFRDFLKFNLTHSLDGQYGGR